MHEVSFTLMSSDLLVCPPLNPGQDFRVTHPDAAFLTIFLSSSLVVLLVWMTFIGFSLSTTTTHRMLFLFRGNKDDAGASSASPGVHIKLVGLRTEEKGRVTQLQYTGSRSKNKLKGVKWGVMARRISRWFKIRKMQILLLIHVFNDSNTSSTWNMTSLLLDVGGITTPHVNSGEDGGAQECYIMHNTPLKLFSCACAGSRPHARNQLVDSDADLMTQVAENDWASHTSLLGPIWVKCWVLSCELQGVVVVLSTPTHITQHAGILWAGCWVLLVSWLVSCGSY